MGNVSITGIIINVILVVVIILLLVLGFSYNSALSTCLNFESPYCYTLQCPCDNNVPVPPAPAPKAGPCFGFAKRPGPREGTWYCSSAIYTLVDDDGNRV